MVFRSFHFRSVLISILILGLVSCSKKDQNNISSTADIQQYSLLPGKDATSIIAYSRSISVRVPDTVFSGNNLIASYTISPGASLSMNGVHQQSGITANNFDNDVQYVVTAADGHTQKIWTVQATNSDYSIPWGLGHFINKNLALNRSYNWYIDQETSGQFADVNCGPASVTMGIKWADSTFTKTAADARATYETSGGWWYTNDIDAYLSKYDISHVIISLSERSDSTGYILTHQLDNHQIVILCLDMNYVRLSTDPDFRVDKFYSTSPNWGHFIVLKGYRQVDGELFFEAYDPNSYENMNADNTLKGMNRFYRYEDLAAACLPWWNYAFVIAAKGNTLDLDAINRKLNPAHVPVAHSSTRIF